MHTPAVVSLGVGELATPLGSQLADRRIRPRDEATLHPLPRPARPGRRSLRARPLAGFRPRPRRWTRSRRSASTAPCGPSASTGARRYFPRGAGLRPRRVRPRRPRLRYLDGRGTGRSQRLPSPPRRDEGFAPIGPPRRNDPRPFGMAFEPVSRRGFLTADRPGPVAYRACTSTSGCMCTESPCQCAGAGIPHVAARVAVAPRPHERRCRTGWCGRDGSDPGVRHASHATAMVGMCTPSHPRLEVTPGHQSRAGRRWAADVNRLPRGSDLVEEGQCAELWSARCERWPRWRAAKPPRMAGAS